jgi:signal transduction histidine kinase/AraC-like DNA-binding protein
MMTKILVVDDELTLQPLMKQRFRRKIQAGEYSFHFATSSREALATLRDVLDFDVVLLDINMPDMDGLTLLNQLPELAPTSRAVMVSAYGDLTNIRSAMNRGAFDFVMKPINFEDLEMTIDKTAQHVGALRESIRAKAVAELKARFFDNITHEFRTPLSLILAPIDALLQNPRHDETSRRSLLTVRRNANHLLQLINQLLDLARLEATGIPVVESPGDTVLFVEELVNSFRSLADQKGIHLLFTTNATRQQARFDADKWQKIVHNLVSNALKFTAAGGQVSVSCRFEVHQLQLAVTDTGVGIANQHLPHIFDRFFQVDSSSTRAYEGSGIGLALAYELTSLLGGQLRVDSSPGVGTCFTLTLPVSKAMAADRSVVTHQPSIELPTNLAVSQPVGLTTDSALPLILLVEDNAELVLFLAESLSGQYRILTAANGRQGLEVALQEVPDIVVSDVMMPQMDGYQLTQQLKTNPITDHIAVLLLTARAAIQQRREGLSQGADDYLTKPFDLIELQLRLHNLISRQQRLRRHYQSQLSPVVGGERTLGKADEEADSPQVVFLAKLHQIIEAHLDESTFRSESLAEEVAMSIRTLNRKLTTLTGIAPALLIRTYRLKRATEFLRAGHTVSETAYLVGFEHPTNFTTAFREHFHQTPTDFIQSPMPD